MPHPPNFLFITTDQQRWDTLRCAGNPAIRTPHLDALAARGVRFNRAYPNNPICMPSRATMITGRSQRGHQVFEHEINLSENIPVLGDALHEVGYTTALFGKPHFKVWEIEDSLPEHPPAGAAVNPRDGLWHGPYYGFDYVSHFTGHRSPSGHWRVWLEREHPESIRLWEPEASPKPAVRSGAWHNAIPKEHHHTHFFADELIDWLDGRAQTDETQPFFAWLSFPDPHGPFCPPAPYSDMYDPADMPLPVPADDDFEIKPPHYRWSVDRKHSWYGGSPSGSQDEDNQRQVRALYYGMITFIDDMIGRVLQALERHGLASNTHVIFTSDHGEMIDDHGQGGKPPMTYESVIRVPLLWAGPEVPDGRVHDGVMTHTDLTPPSSIWPARHRSPAWKAAPTAPSCAAKPTPTVTPSSSNASASNATPASPSSARKSSSPRATSSPTTAPAGPASSTIWTPTPKNSPTSGTTPPTPTSGPNLPSVS